jgi:DHA2 family multidrug resistance protein
VATTVHDTDGVIPIRARGAAAAAEDPYRHKYLIAIAVTLGAVLELIDTSIVNVAIPHMMGNLGATLDEIAWVSVSYIIANVIIIPMSGWLSAYFGRKRYLTGSILLFVLASFFCGAATSLWGLVFWRVVQGLGGGALLATAQSTLFEAFPPKEVGVGQAIFGMGVMVGPTLGPTLGGWIVDNYAWPWIFYINVPLGLIAAVMVFTYVRDSAHQVRAQRIDVLGIVLLTVCVGALQWMLERGERMDWFESPMIGWLAATAFAAGATLVWHELRTDEPIIDLRILKSKQLAAGETFAAFLGFALFGSVFVLPIFLQSLHGMTAWQTGRLILPGAIASAFTMAVMGRQSSKIDVRILIPIGTTLFAIAMWRLSVLTLDAGASDMFWPLILRGIGLGFIFVPLTNAAMAELPMRHVAQGTGLFNLTRQLGGSLGIAVMATLFARFGASERAILRENVVAGSPVTTERVDALTRGMLANGVPLAQAKQQALMVLDRQIAAQASVLAFSRLYLLTGLILLAALPLLLFFRIGKGRPVHGAH